MICKYCAHWEPDIDPETGVEIHRCACCASPRLDDVTEANDSNGYTDQIADLKEEVKRLENKVRVWMGETEN